MMSEEISQLKKENKRLKERIENLQTTGTLLKCRDCLFKTRDITKMLEHANELDHHDYAILTGGKVVVDWMHIDTEIIRQAPE